MSKGRRRKISYAKTVAIAVFVMAFIGLVIGCVLGWLRVSDLELKLSAYNQTEQGEENGGTPSEEDKAPARKLARTTAELIAPDEATTFAVVQENTYTELPEEARHIEVGDNLSGALLYIDYPNLQIPSGHPYLVTDGSYYIWKQPASGMCFGYDKVISPSSMTWQSMPNNYFISCYANTWGPSSSSPKPITAYVLPEDFGTVTTVGTSEPEHSALYVVDGDLEPAEPKEPVPAPETTQTNPYPEHSFECGAVLEGTSSDLRTYTDGYLCVNVSAMKMLLGMGSMNSGGSTTIISFATYNGVVIGGNQLYYRYLISSSQYATVKLCDASTTSDYVYLNVDLENVINVNAIYANANTIRYISEVPHDHITTETEFPVKGCSADCIKTLQGGMTYDDGYLVIKTAAFNTYAASHSGILFYTDNHNYNYFEIENGKLLYKQYLGSSVGGSRNSMTVYDGNTDTEYVYVHLTQMQFTTTNNVNTLFYTAFIGYLSTEHGNYTLPDTPEKEGYDFVGWFYGTEEYHKESNQNCTPYNGEHIITDTAFHAHFTIKKFKVTYDSNGGSIVTSETVDWNTSAPIKGVVRTGYNLISWYLEDGTPYTGQAITSDTTLKAEWTIKVFTVTFYVEGKTVKTMTVEYGTQLIAVSEAAEISVQDIIAASYVNEQNTDVDVTEMLVVDDMTVQLANHEVSGGDVQTPGNDENGDNVQSAEPSAMDKVMSVLQQYQILFIVGAVIVFAGVVTATVFITRKLNSTRR